MFEKFWISFIVVMIIAVIMTTVSFKYPSVGKSEAKIAFISYDYNQ